MYSLPDNVRLIFTGNPPEKDYLGETNDLLQDGALNSNRLLDAFVDGIGKNSLERDAGKEKPRTDGQRPGLETQETDAQKPDEAYEGHKNDRILLDHIQNTVGQNKFPCSDILTNLVNYLIDTNQMNGSTRSLIKKLIKRGDKGDKGALVQPGKIVALVGQNLDERTRKQRFLSGQHSPTTTEEEAFSKYQSAKEYKPNINDYEAFGMLMQGLQTEHSGLEKHPIRPHCFTYTRDGHDSQPGTKFILEGFMRNKSIQTKLWYCMISREADEEKAVVYIGGSTKTSNFPNIDEALFKRWEADGAPSKDFFRGDGDGSGKGRFRECIKAWLNDGGKDHGNDGGGSGGGGNDGGGSGGGGSGGGGNDGVVAEPTVLPKDQSQEQTKKKRKPHGFKAFKQEMVKTPEFSHQFVGMKREDRDQELLVTFERMSKDERARYVKKRKKSAPADKVADDHIDLTDN